MKGLNELLKICEELDGRIDINFCNKWIVVYVDLEKFSGSSPEEIIRMMKETANDWF
jgi:hypothetical protein